MSEKMTETGIMDMECGAGIERIQDKLVNKNVESRDQFENGYWFDRSDHPLLNDVVLRKVFEHLKPRDLMTCRVVCKKWNTSTIPFTRSKCRVRIDGNRLNRLPKSIQEFYGSGEDYKTRAGLIENFIEVFSKNQLGIPFARFRLGSFRMTDGVGQEFVKLCGDFVQYINLSNDDCFDVEDVSELLKSAPNLKKFYIPTSLRSRSGNAVKLFPDDSPMPKLSFMGKLKSTFDYPEARKKFCPTFIEELITAAENISHLSLTYSSMKYDDQETMSTSFEALTVIEKLGRESSIQTLEFSSEDMDGAPEHFELLSRMQAKGMRLKRVNVCGGTEDPFHIQMTTLFKDTLEHYSPDFCSSFMGFPTMPRLKLLEPIVMTGFDYGCTHFESGCINICKSFPALEKLTLRHIDDYDDDDDVYDEFFPDSEPCENMKSFILYGALMKVKPFTRIQTVFPNLTELKLTVTLDGVEILRSMWSGMPQLKLLKLWGQIRTTDNENMDSIFTGLSIPALQAMEKLVKSLDEITSKEHRATIIEEIINGASQDRPSIRNLSNLSQLYLSITGQGNDEQGTTTTYLTPLTGYLALYSVKQIRQLVVGNCQFTKTCCEILAMDMGLQSWEFVSPQYARIFPEMEEDWED